MGLTVWAQKGTQPGCVLSQRPHSGGDRFAKAGSDTGVNSAETEQRRGQEMTTPNKDRKQRTCMGTECGFCLPVQKWGKQDSCGSLVLPAPPTPFLAPPNLQPHSPPSLCSSYTGLPTSHVFSCFQALAHVTLPGTFSQ